MDSNKTTTLLVQRRLIIKNDHFPQSLALAHADLVPHPPPTCGHADSESIVDDGPALNATAAASIHCQAQRQATPTPGVTVGTCPLQQVGEGHWLPTGLAHLQGGVATDGRQGVTSGPSGGLGRGR